MRIFQRFFLCFALLLLLGACSWLKGLVGYDDKPAEDAKPVDPVALAETAVCAELSADDCKAGGEKLLAKDDSQSDAMALVFFNQACDKDNAVSCNQSGTMYKKGIGTKEDPKEAVKRFSQACNIDKITGCYETALAYRNGGTVDKDLKLAAQYFDYACSNAADTDINKGKSCTQEGLLLLEKASKDKTAIQEVYQAFEYFLKGCKAGDGQGCFRTGAAYQSGRGVAGSDVFARQYYALGCDAKVGKSCLMAGNMNADINPKDASDYYFTGCSLNNKDACFELAERYRLGNAIVKNQTMAKITYQQVCSKRIPLACYWQAYLMQQQINDLADAATPEDTQSIIAAYKTACDADVSLACYQLAAITQKGAWVKPNPPQVAQYLTPGCSKKEWLGCYDLALLYLSGNGVEASPEKSSKLFKQVCDADAKTPISLELSTQAEHLAEQNHWQVHACWQLAEMLWEYPLKVDETDNKPDSKDSDAASDGGESDVVVKPLAKDNKTALIYYNKTCELNGMMACLKYAYALDKGIATKQDEEQAFRYYSHACSSNEFEFEFDEISIARLLNSIKLTAERDNKPSNKDLLQNTKANACYNLAVNFRDGIGTDKSERKANLLFKKSCELKQGWGCYNYALSGSESDLSFLYFERACKLGYSKACDLAKENN